MSLSGVYLHSNPRWPGQEFRSPSVYVPLCARITANPGNWTLETGSEEIRGGKFRTKRRLPTLHRSNYESVALVSGSSELPNIGCRPPHLIELHERHQQARVKQNYIHSPLIHQFPLEIVTSIFLLASPPQEACRWCSLPGEKASPLVLTKVCRTWRALALSIPRIWSCISVDADKPNFPLLNHQIAHSGVIPLSVYVNASECGSRESLASAKHAMSFVIKNLPRIGSLYLILTDDAAMACGSISDLDYPKTAPLLKNFHLHSIDEGPISSFQLKLAIEPPSPRQVHLDRHSFDQVCLNWTSVSSLTLQSHIQMLPPTLTSLQHLYLSYADWDLPMGRTPVVNPSIQVLTTEECDPAAFMLTMTLPSLQWLDVHINDIQTLSPITCDFLHRSICSLQVLCIRYDAANFDRERPIQAVIDVLEITKKLRHLDLQLWNESFAGCPSSSLEPLVRRLSQDRSFLPCLQTLSLDTPIIPLIDSLLDAMAPNAPASEIPNGHKTERPLHTLKLSLNMSLGEIEPIRQDVLVRILQMRAAGKEISITCRRFTQRQCDDVVEHWKNAYGFGED